MRDISVASAAMTDKTNRNKAIIIEVLTSAFTKRDFAALERWFSPGIGSAQLCSKGRRGFQDSVQRLEIQSR